MEDTEDYSPEKLHKCSYRFLQQTAKKMGLPSNIKKVCMIQLIHAKKYGSSEIVERLVKQVRQQRQHSTLVRKRAMNKKKYAQQSTEVSSTSDSKSPPISGTMKRAKHFTIRNSPEQNSLLKNVNRNISDTNTIRNISDRVLRSFRGIRKPNYILNNTIDIIKTSSSEKSVKTTQKMTICKKDKCLQVDYESFVRKRCEWANSKGIVPVRDQRSVAISPKPVRRQRRLSGIYPLNEETTTLKKVNVSIRRADGTLAKLNAFIPKPPQRKNQLLSIESAERHTALNMDNFSNRDIFSENLVSGFNSTNPTDVISMSMCSFKENRSEYNVYYHKKIRFEQKTSITTKDAAISVNNENRLPKINDAFSKFNNYNRGVTQPIFVQVDSEPLTVPSTSIGHKEHKNGYETCMLENIYNLKNLFVLNESLLKVSTSEAKTETVFSNTPIMSTATEQPSTDESSIYNTVWSQDSGHYSLEDAEFKNYVCNQGSLELNQSQDLNANITASEEMVEDAFEVISQDGDYMERMGMDVRMQCVLCDWAGPKIMLEYHIRTDHTTEINDAECSDWSTTYTLGSLVEGKQWCSKVLDRAARLFVLSAKYDDPDCFRATLSTLSSDYDTPMSGSITMYNNVTGEPFTWKGLIQQLPPVLSFNDTDCLKIELSKLNVLPNSANLKLLNRELVVRSPTKVVVGQPELDNILITVFVNWD